jgi:hypothetical protein
LMEATGIGEIDGIITEYQTPGLARVTWSRIIFLAWVW